MRARSEREDYLEGEDQGHLGRLLAHVRDLRLALRRNLHLDPRRDTRLNPCLDPRLSNSRRSA